MKDYRYLVFIVLIGTMIRLSAQEKFGIANSNYMSTSAIFLNPSASVDSKTYAQLNLVGASAFLMNNIAYAKDFSIYGHAKNEPYIQQVVLSTLKIPKFAFANISVDGPAFVMSKDNYGFGVFVRARSVSSAHAGSIFSATSLFIQEQTGASTTSLTLNNTTAASMSWLEVGGNFGIVVHRTRNSMLSLGVNLRYLSGVNLLYANMTRLSGWYNDSIVNVENMQGKLRFTDVGFNIGSGIGTDIGITYKKMLGNAKNYFSNSVRCDCKQMDYKYKVGITLRDLGYIKFRKTAYAADVSGSGSYYTDRNDTSYIQALAQVANTAITNRPVLATLPTALVGQLDWNFENHFYIGSTIIQNVVPGRLTGVRSTNLISVAPRYEWQQFEFAMPVTLQNYVYPMVGLALRYRTFAVGVDNIFPLLHAKNTYGAGIYFNLGISLFKNPACRKKTRRVDRCPVKINDN